MQVTWKEAGMAGLVAGLFALGGLGSRGIGAAFLASLLIGAAVALAYRLLMPLVVRWAEKGLPKPDPEDPDAKA